MIAWLVGLALLVVYGLTAAPDVTFVDSGELTAVAATLGIAHPTGYPLYTLLGRVATLLPGSAIANVTWLSAVCVALGAVLLAGWIELLLRHQRIPDREARWLAIASGIAIGLGATIWQQAVIVEVYGLAFALFALLLWSRSRDAADAPYLFGYVAGLAAANHLSVLPLLPLLAVRFFERAGVRAHAGLLWGASTTAAILAAPSHELLAAALAAGGLVWLVVAGRRPALATLVKLGAPAVLAISLYSVLPVRSRLDPLLDWGNPETLATFWQHITGKVYHVWFLASLEAAIDQLALFGRLALRQWTPLGVILAAIGIVAGWRRRRSATLRLGLVAAANVLYASNYEIHDIDAYFIPALTLLGVAMALGYGTLLATLRSPRIRRVALLATMALPAMALAANWQSASQRHNLLVRDFTDAMLASLDHGAVVLTRQWDYFCSAQLHDHLVDGRRTDVTVLEKELLRRTWYLQQIRRWDAALCAPCDERFADFARSLAPFEAGRSYDANRLQSEYVALIQCLLVSGEAAGRPIYLTPDAVEPGIAEGFVPVVQGLAMRLTRSLPDTLPAATLPPIRDLAAAAHSSVPLEAGLASVVLDMRVQRAVSLVRLGRYDAARATLDDVLAVRPDHQAALAWRARVDALFAP